MPKKIVDLSLAVEDNMSAHKLFQRPVDSLAGAKSTTF